VLEDVLIKAREFIFPVNFAMLTIERVANVTNQILVILMHPFFATSNALIHCKNKMM